jgi:hypothetical protein
LAESTNRHHKALIDHKKYPLLTMMMPALNDDTRSKKQESRPTTSPASVRAFWRGPLPSFPSTMLVEEQTGAEETARHQSRSKVIPMRVMRGSTSSSELQLYQEHAEADARDYSMFLKVYDHLKQQRTRTTDQTILAENALCMDRLIQTRYRHIHGSSLMRGGFGGRVSSPDGADRKHFRDKSQDEEEEEDDIGEEDIFQLDL